MPAVLGAVSGCLSTGPVSIRRDRFQYNEAGADSAKEQMLLNIVRLRYGEPIYFIDIASMLSQYTVEAAGSISSFKANVDVWQSQALRAAYGVDSDPSRTRTLGADLTVSDRPTITYAPVQGQEFANRVLSPLPAPVIFYLSDAGWRLDQVFGCCVQKVNEVENDEIYIREAPSADHSESFHRLIKLLQKRQDSGRLDFTLEKEANDKTFYLRTREAPATPDPEVEEIAEILGIERDAANRYQIIEGSVRKDPHEIAIQTRSLLTTMNALARRIDPPPEHIESGRALPIVPQPADAPADPWLKVEYSRTPRLDSFAQVSYKGYWFYIPDTDWRSKSTFSLLAYLYAVQASGLSSNLPIVTVPAR